MDQTCHDMLGPASRMFYFQLSPFHGILPFELAKQTPTAFNCTLASVTATCVSLQRDVDRSKHLTPFGSSCIKRGRSIDYWHQVLQNRVAAKYAWTVHMNKTQSEPNSFKAVRKMSVEQPLPSIWRWLLFTQNMFSKGGLPQTSPASLWQMSPSLPTRQLTPGGQHGFHGLKELLALEGNSGVVIAKLIAMSHTIFWQALANFGILWPFLTYYIWEFDHNSTYWHTIQRVVSGPTN